MDTNQDLFESSKALDDILRRKDEIAESDLKCNSEAGRAYSYNF